MNISYLNDLDELIDHPSDIQGQWIIEIPDKELYKISIWLLHHLGPNKFQTNHNRTRLRDICEQFYLTNSWSDKQKFYLGYGVINLWGDRQVENDPRYIL